MSSGRRAQNLLNLKIARSCPGISRLSKACLCCGVQGSVPCEKQNVCCNPDTQPRARLRPVCLPWVSRPIPYRSMRLARSASSIGHLGRYIRCRNSSADQDDHQYRGVRVWVRWRYARIVLDVADQRLCRAKREGRNCVIAVQAVAEIVAREISAEFLWAGMSPRVTFEIICNF
jgi:hypothetical protein